MSLINDKTTVTALPSLDFFANTPIQDTYDKTYTEIIRPISQLNSGPQVEFVINNNQNEYIRLSETTLYLKFRVKLRKSDSATVVAADWTKVSVVNNLLHSLWSQIDLQIGDAQTSVALQTYAYRAYIETILGSTPQSRGTFLKLALFSEDDLSSNQNAHNADRKSFIAQKTGDKADEGKLCELQGKLHLDLFEQPRDLIGGCKLRLKLIQQRPEFYFMVDDVKVIPYIHFEDIQLRLLKSRAKPETIEGHILAQNVGLIKYILNRTEVRTITIDPNVTSKNLENVICGQIPRRIYIGFIVNEAKTGSYTRNPFYFNNCNVTSITCFVNGERYPQESYKPDFSNNLYSNEYLEFLRTSEQFDNDVRTFITPTHYKSGYTLFAFNLSPDHSQGYGSCGYVNYPKEGILRFEIQFASGLDKSYDAIIFCEFDNLLSIGQEKNAIMDYR